jgi:hypothetical protein
MGAPGQRSGISGVTIGLLSVGGVGLGLGTVTGALSLSKTSALGDVCQNQRCPANQSDALSSAKTMAWVSNVSLGVGVLAAGFGLAFLYMDLTKSPAKATGKGVRPLVSFGGQSAYIGVSGSM